MHSKQIYEPRETFGILLSPEITPLLTKPLLPYYPLGISRACTIVYKENTYFAGFLMAFFFFWLGIWTYILVFPCVSQGPLLKVSKWHIKVLGPWCSFCYISFDRDPCYMSSDRDPLLFSLLLLLLLLLLLFLSLFFSFFLGLWAFMVLLNFMNWAFFCLDPWSFFTFHGMGFLVKFWSSTLAPQAHGLLVAHAQKNKLFLDTFLVFRTNV